MCKYCQLKYGEQLPEKQTPNLLLKSNQQNPEENQAEKNNQYNTKRT